MSAGVRGYLGYHHGFFSASASFLPCWILARTLCCPTAPAIASGCLPAVCMQRLTRGKAASPVGDPRDCRLRYPARWSQKIQVALMSSPDLAALGAGRMGIPLAHPNRQVPPAFKDFGALLQSTRLPRQRRAGKPVLQPPSLLLGSCFPAHLMPQSHFRSLSRQLRGGSLAGFVDPHATNRLNKWVPLMP